MNSTTTHDNDRVSKGGGGVVKQSDIVFTDSTISNNKATGPYGFGGAFYADDGSTVDFITTLIQNNIGERFNGGVAVMDSTLGVMQSTFSNNTGNVDTNMAGSSIYGDTSTVIVDKTVFSSHGDDDSGAYVIYANNPVEFIVDTCT